MNSILRVVINSRNHLFTEEVIIGECHRFEGGWEKSGCNCTKSTSAEPIEIATLKYTKC